MGRPLNNHVVVRRLLPFSLSALTVALDQLTKALVLHFWPEPGRIYLDVIPGCFSLAHCQNQGAAWGIFSGHLWMLGVFSAVAAAAIILFWRWLTAGNRFCEWCYAFLLGGIVGNMIDRFWRPGVIDFLHFYYQRWAWPTFNVADIAITCSILLLVLHGFVNDWRARKAKTAEGQ